MFRELILYSLSAALNFRFSLGFRTYDAMHLSMVHRPSLNTFYHVENVHKSFLTLDTFNDLRTIQK